MTDIIAAVATAQGLGGIAIVRMSGEGSKKILDKAFKSASETRPRRAVYGNVVDSNGDIIDEAIAIYMPAPRSYTREDVCEIQCHGGREAAGRVLKSVLELGARNALPGEFTKRAFLNGRLDMAQAEAVMSVIKADNEMALRSAARQLKGGVSKRVQQIASSITSVLADIEAACDFPEEIDTPASAESVRNGIVAAMRDIDASIDPRAARIINSGLKVAIVGRPNTGKSSLLNALAGFDRAIVSPVAGTTRDAVTCDIDYGGLRMRLTDTAGQRETSDDIENIGVCVAKRAENEADAVVAVIDGSMPLQKDDIDILSRADRRFIIALNKSDVYLDAPAVSRERLLSYSPCVVDTSAVSHSGADGLLSAISDLCANVDPESDILTVERHIGLAKDARAHLETALRSLDSGFPPDLCSVDVQLAAQSILSIRGLDASQAAIDDIFSRFCVGK